MPASESAAPRLFDAGAVARSLADRPLIEALRAAFAAGAAAPHRQVIPLPEGALLAVMPIWGATHGAVKLATLFPGNAACGLPTIQALVVLFDGRTGAPVALADGTEITRRRTAAASALAAGYLARADASRLLVIGTGALAPHLIRAHAAVRPIAEVLVWGRDPTKAAAVAASAAAAHSDLAVRAAPDLAVAAAQADLISCATAAREPVLRGAWLKAGTHVDLVGSFSPDTREADDDVMRGARIFVDTRDGALTEAGDLLIPLASGVIGPDDVVAELSDLCAGRVLGRASASEITVFKSVGAALEDLVAAELLMERLR